MELVFLGSGTGAPSARRGAPGLAVLTAGATILIDSGSGTLRQLERAGLSYNRLDHILYTHFHPDHTGDLVAYLFATQYFAAFTRAEPAVIHGPEGLLRLYEALRSAYGRWIEPPEDRVIWHELPIGRATAFSCGPLAVESRPVPHNPESLGYRLTEPGGPTLVVSGDTDYGPDLIELARGADLFVTECSFPGEIKVDGHLTAPLAGLAAREAGVKALALTHFYPETEGHDLAAQAAREFDGPIILAEDLLRLPVPPRRDR